jgi:hypothetical protein
MMMRTLLASVCIAISVKAQTVTLTPVEGGLKVEVDGQLFTQYVTATTYHQHLHPVIGPGGSSMTRVYPLPEGSKDDHPHHASMWIGHGDVNGLDFWTEAEDKGRVQHVEFGEIKSGTPIASFVARSRWVKPDGTEVCTDERLYEITALAGGARQIDCTVSLIASAGELTLGDTKEGTFAFRAAAWLSYEGDGATGKILNSEGGKDKKVWGKQARWVSFYGQDPASDVVSVTMMDHPQNLRHPTYWHARTYGLFAANPFGLHDFQKLPDKTLGQHIIPAGQKLTQKYRVLLQKGAADAAQLEAHWQQFAE